MDGERVYIVGFLEDFLFMYIIFIVDFRFTIIQRFEYFTIWAVVVLVLGVYSKEVVEFKCKK